MESRFVSAARHWAFAAERLAEVVGDDDTAEWDIEVSDAYVMELRLHRGGGSAGCRVLLADVGRWPGDWNLVADEIVEDRILSGVTAIAEAVAKADPDA